MKKMKFLLSAILLLTIQQVANAQWTGATGGINYSGGNVGIGTTNPRGLLDIKSPTHGYLWLEGTSGSSFFTAKHSTNGEGGLCVVSGDNILSTITFKLGSGWRFFESGSNQMVLNGGKLGLGTEAPQYKLDVNGTIRGQELVCEAPSAWPDYVFSSNYQLMPLVELSSYIKKYNHLPNIPSASEIENEGLELAKMNIKLLEKIEELTLYTLDQEKQIKLLLERLEAVETKLK